MTIQLAKTRPMTDTVRCIRDFMVAAGARSTWPLCGLADYAGVDPGTAHYPVFPRIRVRPEAVMFTLASYPSLVSYGEY